MTDEHIWPADEWAELIADAVQQAQRIAAGHPAREAPHGLMAAERLTGALPLDGVVVAARHGGSRKAPTFGVLHSAETPLQVGMAAAIARMFAVTKEDKSCHYMTDPAETWGVLDDLLTAWHCGNGNPASVGLEQSGRAAMSRAQWLAGGEAGPGYAQLRRNATVMQAQRDRYGIGCWWMTDQQIRDAHARKITGGWCTHDDARRVLGGTTHTDPGNGFPADLQMQLANHDGEDLTMADAASLEQQLAQAQKDLAYVVGQLRGQEKDKQGDTGWLMADGQARTLVDAIRATFVQARTAATRPVSAEAPGELVTLESDGEPLTVDAVRQVVRDELAALVLAVPPEQSR